MCVCVPSRLIEAVSCGQKTFCGFSGVPSGLDRTGPAWR